MFRRTLLKCETQVAFAKKTGLSLPTIKKLERGGMPSIETMRKLHNAALEEGYDINVMEFFKHEMGRE